MLDGAIPGALIIWDLRGQLPSLLAFVPFIPCSLFGRGRRRKKVLLDCTCSVAKTGKIHFAPKWPKGPKWNCTVVRSSSKNIRYKISCVCVTYIRQKATKGGTENYSSFGRSPEVQVENGFSPGRGPKGLWAALRGEALYSM